MISFINKLLTQNLRPPSIRSSPEFSVEAEYENDFLNYYQQYLQPLFQEYSSQKLQKLEHYNKLFYNSLIIALVSLIITIIILFTPLHNYYNIMASGFNHAIESYTIWWKGLPRWIQIISPSKLIIWSFPNPLVLEFLILFCIIFYLFISLLRTRTSIKEKILLPIYGYMGDFFYTPNTFIENLDFYNALMLPSHDQVLFEDGSIIANYPDANIEIVETSLIIHDQDSRLKPNTPTFIGLLIAVNFPKDIPIKGHHVFTSTLPEWLENLFAKEKKLSRYGYSGISELYSSNIEEIKKIDPNGLLNTLDEIAKIVANNNKNTSYIDYGIISLLKRKKTLHPIKNIDTLIQCAIYEQKLFIILPTNRELLLTQSIFDNNSNIYNQDMHIILAAVYLTFLFIKHINTDTKHE
ncbi:MAG: hypothetical protein AB8U25_02640 [Rickettsiales endosymbiont of Dermacentor nuttalli]